jgi:hypothetical protein
MIQTIALSFSKVRSLGMNIDLRDIKTFYINLDKHKEKNELVAKEIEASGIKDFTRISGVDMPKNKESGCASSHYKILSKESSPLLILEDDCAIYKNNPVISVPDNADAVYIGLSRWGYRNNVSKINNYSYSPCRGYKDIYRVNGMLATHAILYLSEEYIDISKRVAKYCADNSVHVDVGFTEIHKYYNVYAMGQPFFYQSTNEKSTKIFLRGSRS